MLVASTLFWRSLNNGYRLDTQYIDDEDVLFVYDDLRQETFDVADCLWFATDGDILLVATEHPRDADDLRIHKLDTRTHEWSLLRIPNQHADIELVRSQHVSFAPTSPMYLADGMYYVLAPFKIVLIVTLSAMLSALATLYLAHRIRRWKARARPA